MFSCCSLCRLGEPARLSRTSSVVVLSVGTNVRCKGSYSNSKFRIPRTMPWQLLPLLLHQTQTKPLHKFFLLCSCPLHSLHRHPLSHTLRLIAKLPRLEPELALAVLVDITTLVATTTSVRPRELCVTESRWNLIGTCLTQPGSAGSEKLTQLLQIGKTLQHGKQTACRFCSCLHLASLRPLCPAKATAARCAVAQQGTT
mmetsp:Transcript_14045/g.27253  ORF Transcript_14045/g.27253 Transcript_14045/m.27253 type:complete len:200 (+) Transcript_14045:489-1088(+)